MGAIIAPPVPAFYNKPKTLDDIIDHSVGRVLDLFDIDTGKVKRWSYPTTCTISSAVSAGNVPFISATTAARSLASGTTPRHTA